MLRFSILAVCTCVSFTLAHVPGGGGQQRTSFGGKSGGAFGSRFDGDKLGGTSTLRSRGVIADPLSQNNFGKNNAIAVQGSSFGGGNKGPSLIGNDNLFRKQQGIDGSYGSFSSSQSGGSSKGFGGSLGSGSSFGSSKGVGGSLGSDNLFGGSKGIGGNSFGYGSSFGTNKGAGSSFDSNKGIGNSFGSSKVIGPSFGSPNDIEGSFNQGIGGKFGGAGNSLKGNQGFSVPYGAENSFGGGFGKGNNVIPSGKGSPASFSGDYVNSFNQGYGIQGDNLFGKGSGGFGGGNVYGSAGIGGKTGAGFGGNKGFVNSGYGNDFQAGYGGQGGFGKSNSVSNKGSSFSSGGFSSKSGGGVQDFKDFNDAEGLGRVRGEYGISDGSLVGGNGGSFGKSGGGSGFNQGYSSEFGGKGGSIAGKSGFTKGSGFSQFGGNSKGLNFGNTGIISGGRDGGKGFDGGLYSTDTLRGGNTYGGQGVWGPGGSARGLGGNGKGFSDDLYTLDGGRGSVVGGGVYGDTAFRGKAGLGKAASSFNAGPKGNSFGVHPW